MKYPIEKMRRCIDLLPPPGGEVVAECLDEIESLRQQLAETQHSRDVFFDSWERKTQQLAELQGMREEVLYYQREFHKTRDQLAELKKQNEELMIEICRRSTK